MSAGVPRRVQLGRDETDVPVVDGAMVGSGIRLQQRMGSLRRYLVAPIGPEEEVVGVVVRYPDGIVVQRNVEVRKV